MKIKSRKERISEYNEKYSDIPYDVDNIFEYIKKEFKVTDEYIDKLKEDALIEYEQNSIFIRLFETPIPYMRGRVGYGKSIYTPLAKENSNYIIDSLNIISEFKKIYTPMHVKSVFYLPMPKSFSKDKVILGELGILRPINTPDIDNLIKGYLDAFNDNVFLDDSLILDLEASKYFSLKPRVEILIKYDKKFINNTDMKKILKRIKMDNNRKLEIIDRINIGKYYGGDEEYDVNKK